MGNERYIKADEIEVRPCEVTEKSVRLLLYQDARRVLKILDETYGLINWQREYYQANGLLFCKIGVKDEEGRWIWKSDTGSSGGIEEEKSLATDAFKRAAVAWGIGRELYTAPRIVVELNDRDYYNGRLCQSFHVGSIEIKDGIITGLTILDKWDKVRFEYGRPSKAEGQPSVSDANQQEGKDGAKHNSNQDRLIAFYTSAKSDGHVDTARLEDFFTFYSKPSKEDPSVSVADSMKFFDPKKRWESWINR